MRNKTAPSPCFFKECFSQLLCARLIAQVFLRWGPGKRRKFKLHPRELLMGMVFHVMSGAGTLAEHVSQVTGIDISDSAISQRRSNLCWDIFEAILKVALKPRAEVAKHPTAFYCGLRLCGLDGSLFSVANTPQVKKRMKKAKTRRLKAAFAKVGVGVLVELGIHNPIAASVTHRGDSEMVLAQPLILSLPEKSLLIADRYYGVPKLIDLFWTTHPTGGREFLLRVRSNIQARVLETYRDGSALVEIRFKGKKRLVREIQARVRVGSGKWSTVRLWTSLLDSKKHPADVLVALYARRWEHEGFYRELKVDMRSSDLIQSHTPETAAQEVAALLIAYAILVEQRLKVAGIGEVEVVRISFLKVMETVCGLWRFLELTGDMLTSKQIGKVVAKALEQVADSALGKRRKRSCPRKLRQPVSSWPRLKKNTYKHGAAECQTIDIKLQLP